MNNYKTGSGLNRLVLNCPVETFYGRDTCELYYYSGDLTDKLIVTEYKQNLISALKIDENEGNSKSLSRLKNVIDFHVTGSRALIFPKPNRHEPSK